MSKKSFLIVGIICLALGGGLIPTGYFVNDYLVDLVAGGVPDALLGIQDDAVPSLEDQIPGLATPDVLLGVEEQALENLEEQIQALGTPDVLLGIESEAVTQLTSQIPALSTPELLLQIQQNAVDTINDSLLALSTPSVLLGIKEEAVETINTLLPAFSTHEVLKGVREEVLAGIPAIINASGAAKAINLTLDGVGGFIGLPAAKEQFFNSLTFSTTYGVMKGVSEFVGASIGYNTSSQDYLLYGNAGLSGVLEDLELGGGVLYFMGLYLQGALGDMGVRTLMQAAYNTTWTSIEAFAGYIKNYLWESVVKPQYTGLGLTIDQYAEVLFYDQWANGTLTDTGVLGFINASFAGAPYFEVGLPTETNYSSVLTRALWDETDPDTFVNSSGIQVWLGALAGDPTNITYLLMQFGPYGLDLGNLTGVLLPWLGAFYQYRVRDLLEYQFEMTTEELSEVLFYEHWTNGTMNGAPVIPDGFLNELNPLLGGEPYFEVANLSIPLPRGYSLDLTEALWNETNNYTFVNLAGIEIWLGAAGGSMANITYLLTQFGPYGLDLGNLTGILLPWLGAFYTVRVPQLLLYQYSVYGVTTLEEIPPIMFYEQWANGSLLSDGFLSMLDASLSGSPYFEVGLPYPSNLPMDLTKALWNATNKYTFVSGDGILLWLGALTDAALQAQLVTIFGLNATTELPWLLNWLGLFYSYRVIPLLEYNFGAPFATIVQNAFYEQWAYGTILGESALPEGFLSQLNASFAGAPYFEIGIPTPTTLSLSEVAALWDETNNYTFVHTDGILVWLDAVLNDTDSQTDILTAFGSAGLTATELPVLLTWLGNFYTIRVPQLIEYDTGHTVPELAQLSFYEQWANGTIQGEALLPDGFLAELGLTGTPYFEIGLPTATNWSLSLVEDLWDDTNDNTFVTGDGLEMWGEAATNATFQALLMAEFNISFTDLAKILLWLDAFVETRVPQLILADTGYTIPELAQVLFYEQWANGTIYGGVFLPDGFLAERDPPIYGPPYFEVGLTIGATGLSIEQCEALWDEDSDYSLVTDKGINKWYIAERGNAIYEELQEENGDILWYQMDDILEWLPKFRHNIVNKLGKDEYDLPMEPENLGQTIFLAGAAGGGALAALGVVLALLSRRKI